MWHFIFQILLFRKQLSKQMAAVILKAVPIFFAKIRENSLYSSSNRYENYIACKDCCIAHNDDRPWFLPNWRCHIILTEDIEELLQKLYAFCFTYQHVDCLYTLIQYQFSGKVLPIKDECLFVFKELSTLTRETGEWKKAQNCGKETVECWESSTKNIHWDLSENQPHQLTQFLQVESNKWNRLNLNMK